MLYLGNGFVLILQSGSIFQFSLINISATECSLHGKHCFFLTPGYFLRAPNKFNSRSLEHFLIFLEGLSYWELTLYVKVNSKVPQKVESKKSAFLILNFAPSLRPPSALNPWLGCSKSVKITQV